MDKIVEGKRKELVCRVCGDTFVEFPSRRCRNCPVCREEGRGARKARLRSAPIKCLRCDKPFRSVDKVRNRICPYCTEVNGTKQPGMVLDTITLALGADGRTTCPANP